MTDVQDLVPGSLATIGYAASYAQSDLDDVLVANARACIIDTRRTPWCSWSKVWTRPALEQRYKKRYRYAGTVLGNSNYDKPNAPIQLANEAVGIPWIVRGVEQGVTLILLCGCADYARCHRKVIYDKVKAVLGDRLPEYALGQRVMTPDGAGVIDASIPLHVQVMRNRYAVMLDVWKPTRYYAPQQLEPYYPTQQTLLLTHDHLHEQVG